MTLFNCHFVDHFSTYVLVLYLWFCNKALISARHGMYALICDHSIARWQCQKLHCPHVDVSKKSQSSTCSATSVGPSMICFDRKPHKTNTYFKAATSNTPLFSFQKLRSFFMNVSMERYGEPFSEYAITMVWSFAVAIFSVGGMIGSFSVGAMVDRFGR